jgi:hypothetical protein
VSEALPENLTEWSVELMVRSRRGDTYRNRISTQ